MQKGTITYEDFQKMVRLAPPNSGINAKSIAASIEKKGYTLPPELSSYSSVQPQEKSEGKEGFFASVGNALQKRNQQAFGTDTGVIEAARTPSKTMQSESATGRFLRGEQRFGETALQIGGAGAGAISDITGAGLSVLGKGISYATPDFIEKPVTEAVKKAGLSLLQTKVGQAGLAALNAGEQAYSSWKSTHPREASDLESIVNIASIIPVTKAGKTALQAVGADDASKALGGTMKESAEASVAKVLNPTTIATKEATQKLAPEILNRPLTDTLALTRKGMQQKAGAAAETAGEAIQNAGPLSGTTPTSDLINYLQSQKQQFVAGGKIVNKEGVSSIDDVTRIIEQYGDNVDNETLRDIRKIFDSEFYQGKKNIAKTAAETSTLNFKKKAADKIRSILGEKFPDVAALNKEYNFWSGLEDVLSKTTTRKTGQKGALKAVATIGGAVAGQGVAGSVAGALAFRTVAGLVDSPAWGLVSAKIKNRLADALVSHDLSEIGKVLGIIPQQVLLNSVPNNNAQ